MIRVSQLSSILLAGGAVAAGALAPVTGASAKAQEVVQALPDPAEEALNDALRRLSRNPESVPALVAAGRASLDLDDVSAALGFFNRAQAVDPEDGRVLAGLGMVAVRRGEAVTALQLFRNAEAAGERMSPYAAERGLAYDLVGRNDRAQRDYRLALSQDESAEVLRRLALSYAIAGNAEASETTLLPLLQRQDRAAYRTRAFALAIRGREQEAIAIAETMLPPRLSQRLAPYFRYMPQLTRAQQAAAANLGRFPAASEVGQDPAEVAAYARSGDASGAPSPARRRPSDRLEPQGQPLGPALAQDTTPTAGQAGSGAASVAAAQPVSVAQPAPRQDVATPATSGELPAIEPARAERSTAATSPQAPPEATAVVVASLDTRSPPAEEPAAQPSFSLLGNPAPAQPQPTSPATESAPVTLDLAEAFADFTLEGRPVPAMEGAVDITTIDPPRERPAPAEPAPPAHPARHWVQVATGQDTAAFRFDWRRIVRNADGLLNDADAFTARWGQTNRLLTGPFDSARAAQEFVSALAGAGVDSFRFSSEEGEQIQSLD